MRLATYRDTTHAVMLGVVQDDRILNLHSVAGGASLPETMLDLIAAGPAALEQVRRLVAEAPADAWRPLAEIHLLAPIPRPRKNVFCVGMNYLAHAIESAQSRGAEYTPLAHPAFFTKVNTTVSGPTDAIPFVAQVSEQIDWEVELAIVIGAGGKNWSEAEALDHVFGYMVVNDVSARDVQNQHGGQFFKGKSLDGFCPSGPWIVTADEIPDPQTLHLETRVNGVVKQDSSTADMIFPVTQVLAELSAGMTLEPGDIIATGTPSGVGMGRKPQEWLHPGDVVEVEVERIGTLRNRVVEV